jgi:light-regulated signal transduction histidine kinase (bacteriophytochrome)
MTVEPVDLSSMVAAAAEEIQRPDEERKAEFIIQKGLTAIGDQKLLRIAIENLMSNAWKFTRGREITVIEFGETEIEGGKAFYIKDNGVGFDMAYVNKLFGAFQRLHSIEEFEGTGIGLATTKRIMLRHNGSIWAESSVNNGAVFYFTIRK